MIAAGPTRICTGANGALDVLDLRTGVVRRRHVDIGLPHAMAATDAQILWDGDRKPVLCMLDNDERALSVATPPNTPLTHICADPDTDGFLVFGYERRRHRHGRAYALSTAGELTFLCEVEHLFWADYCRVLPGRVALLSYGPIVAVELGTGLVRALTSVERRLSLPSPAPIVYGRRYTACSFPCIESEFAPTEAYSFADHALFGPTARAAARTVLLLVCLGRIRLPHAALLERLLSYVVRTAAPSPPLLTHHPL